MARLREFRIPLLLLGVAAVLLIGAATTANNAAQPQWSMNATAIEACSCPMFCQCYFNPEPAVHSGNEGIHKGHEQGHYCRFNAAYRVNRGSYGATKLDGAKFWVGGDLGGDFRKGQTDWAVLTFDPSVTKAQRDGITVALGKLFPVKWSSFTVGPDAPITWQATKDAATATLGGGKTAEVALMRFQGMTNDPVVIKNLKYWGALRNEGFVLMPNKLEAYRVGDKPFEYKGTNGFMITVDLKSSDFKG
jgi:hypothetical protein